MKRKNKLDPAKRKEVPLAESISRYGWLKTTFELCAELIVSFIGDYVIIDFSDILKFQFQGVIRVEIQEI